jgi:hypothetical protein
MNRVISRDSRVTQSIRSALTRTIYESATHTNTIGTQDGSFDP